MILRYAVTVACVTAAITSQRWMEDYWAGAPAALALCAVMFSAWFGGLGPSLLAMALAIVLFKYFFVIPVYSLAVDIGEAPRLLIFALSVVLVGLLAVAQRGAAESLRRARDQLSRTVRELETSNEALRVENTERNRVEQALRENEQRFRDFADTRPRTGFGRLARTTDSLHSRNASALWASRGPRRSDDGGGTLRVTSRKIPRNGAPISPLMKHTSRSAALSTGSFGQTERRSPLKSVASPFSTAMAASSVIAAPAATSRPRSEVSRPRKGFDRHRPSSLMSAG
jgi:K+-sensing histidine kinase KdpD